MPRMCPFFHCANHCTYFFVVDVETGCCTHVAFRHSVCPLPLPKGSCCQVTCRINMHMHLRIGPLNVYKKDSHHTSLKSADSLALCRCCWRGCRVSSMRQRKNLSPWISWHAQFSEPAKLCSCCLLARLRALKCWSCCWSLSLPKEGDALARPHHLFPTDQKS